VRSCKPWAIQLSGRCSAGWASAADKHDPHDVGSYSVWWPLSFGPSPSGSGISTLERISNDLKNTQTGRHNPGRGIPFASKAGHTWGDNPLGIIEELNAAERAQYDALDKTPPPEELLKEWRKKCLGLGGSSATWTRTRAGARLCSSSANSRSPALLVSAMVLVLNVVGAVAAKTVFRAAVRESWSNKTDPRATPARA